MKTIQEHFREADADDLVTAYLFAHPLTFDPSDEIDPDLTVAEAYARYTGCVRKLVESIRTVEIPDGSDCDEWVFFAHHCPDREGDNISISLAKIDELLQNDGDAASYAYDLSPMCDTAGIRVADTYLTKRNIHKVLLDYLFETSFFGYEQEGLQDVLDRLEESYEQAMSHPETLHPIDEIYETLGYEPEARDANEKEAEMKLFQAEADYCRAAAQIEGRKVAEALGMAKMKGGTS